MQSTYESELSATTDRYSRDQCQSSNYYYQALEMKIETSGIYRFQMNNANRMLGYLYQDTFNPLDPSINLLSESGRECNGYQLWMNTSLLSNTTYILVATTDVPGRTGEFTIRSFGTANIAFSRISE